MAEYESCLRPWAEPLLKVALFQDRDSPSLSLSEIWGSQGVGLDSVLVIQPSLGASFLRSLASPTLLNQISGISNIKCCDVIVLGHVIQTRGTVQAP